MGRNLLSLQHFLHTSNSLQLPLKSTHHAAHSGMRIPYQSPRVFCAPLECPCGVLSSASPNPHHVHWANSQKSPHMHTGLTAIFPMDGAPLCAHHTPFHLTFVNFPTVGGIMVLGVNHLYKPVLALRTSQSL